MFEAFIGHLVGDYILQNDAIAASKSSNSMVCIAHSNLWAVAVMASAGWWFNAGVYVWLLATHFYFDRLGIARRWMTINGQDQFATGPCSPWSIIVVDNTLHLLTIAVAAKYFV